MDLFIFLAALVLSGLLRQRSGETEEGEREEGERKRKKTLPELLFIPWVCCLALVITVESELECSLLVFALFVQCMVFVFLFPPPPPPFLGFSPLIL